MLSTATPLSTSEHTATHVMLSNASGGQFLSTEAGASGSRQQRKFLSPSAGPDASPANLYPSVESNPSLSDSDLSLSASYDLSDADSEYASDPEDSQLYQKQVLQHYKVLRAAGVSSEEATERAADQVRRLTSPAHVQRALPLHMVARKKSLLAAFMGNNVRTPSKFKPSDSCGVCHQEFGAFFNQRCNCRHCGESFCSRHAKLYQVPGSDTGGDWFGSGVVLCAKCKRAASQTEHVVRTSGNELPVQCAIMIQRHYREHKQAKREREARQYNAINWCDSPLNASTAGSVAHVDSRAEQCMSAVFSPVGPDSSASFTTPDKLQTGPITTPPTAFHERAVSAIRDGSISPSVELLATPRGALPVRRRKAAAPEEGGWDAATAAAPVAAAAPRREAGAAASAGGETAGQALDAAVAAAPGQQAAAQKSPHQDVDKEQAQKQKQAQEVVQKQEQELEQQRDRLERLRRERQQRIAARDRRDDERVRKGSLVLRGNTDPASDSLLRGGGGVEMAAEQEQVAVAVKPAAAASPPAVTPAPITAACVCHCDATAMGLAPAAPAAPSATPAPATPAPAPPAGPHVCTAATAATSPALNLASLAGEELVHAESAGWAPLQTWTPSPIPMPASPCGAGAATRNPALPPSASKRRVSFSPRPDDVCPFEAAGEEEGGAGAGAGAAVKEDLPASLTSSALGDDVVLWSAADADNEGDDTDGEEDQASLPEATRAAQSQFLLSRVSVASSLCASWPVNLKFKLNSWLAVLTPCVFGPCRYPPPRLSTLCSRKWTRSWRRSWTGRASCCTFCIRQ
jgi:hypothetical protein